MQIVDAAAGILANADRQLELAAQNIGNMTTPGYRTRQSFQALASAGLADDAAPVVVSASDFAPGKVSVTHNPYDLALASEGFFVVRRDSAVRYTRDGQFGRDGEGRLVTPGGWAVQGDGGDILLHSNRIEVEEDGTVLDNGQPVARLLVRDFADRTALLPVGASAFETVLEGKEILDPQVRQGALESANVSTGQEMIAIMKALRAAESGQRLIQLYDDLLGKAAGSFGQVQG